MSVYQYCSIALCSVALVSCGGGGGGSSSNNGPISSGYTGSTNQASVDDDNQRVVSKASQESIKRLATRFEDLPDFPLTLIEPSKTQGVLAASTKALSGPVASRKLSVDCSDGGSADIDFPGVDGPLSEVPVDGSGAFQFNNCTIDNESTDGELRFSWTGFSDQPVSFSTYSLRFDLVLRTDDEFETFNTEVTCNNSINNCTFSEDFESDSNIGYRAENIAILSNNTGGYNVSGRVYETSNGYVDIVATDIRLNCPNGNISSGNVLVTDATNSEVMSISFGNCDNYIVVFNNVANSFAQ